MNGSDESRATAEEKKIVVKSNQEETPTFRDSINSSSSSSDGEMYDQAIHTLTDVFQLLWAQNDESESNQEDTSAS